MWRVMLLLFSQVDYGGRSGNNLEQEMKDKQLWLEISEVFFLAKIIIDSTYVHIFHILQSNGSNMFNQFVPTHDPMRNQPT